MKRAATNNREAPFLVVGKDLLTYCDQQVYRQMEKRGEDPSWLIEMNRREKEEDRRRAEEEAYRSDAEHDEFRAVAQLAFI